MHPGKCGAVTDNQDDSFNASKAEIFEALGHPTRIRILQELNEKPLAFSELRRAAGLESNGLLTFHLGKLKDLVKLNSDGAYALTDGGREALRLIETVHETAPKQIARAGGSRLISKLPLLLIVPIVTIAVISSIGQVQDFFNPCLIWGIASGGSITVSSNSACSITGGTSETMLQAALQLALVQGGMLFAIGLGVFGLLRAHPRLVIVGSVVLIFESIPLVFDGLFVFALLAAASLLWSMRIQTRPKSLAAFRGTSQV
jgi:DNA-binding transcriptional ArsR family regulator